MDTITVALALPAGDSSHLADLVAGHPLLELCGVARTFEDLVRLLLRFSPDILVISQQMALELDDETLSRWREARLGIVPALLVPGLELPDGEADLSALFRAPFAFCGTVVAESADAEKLYLLAREKVELFRQREGKPRTMGKGRRPPSAGPVILCGSKGGVGNTFLACALAAHHAGRDKRVLLVDLDRERSQLSILKPEGSNKCLLDLLPLAEDLSWEMARVSLYRHPSGFYLLPFGQRPRRGGETSLRLPGPFFRNLDFLFDTVVVDLPGHLAHEFLPFLLPSRSLAVVTQPDALSARCARGLGQSIRGFGIDPSSLCLVINRYGGQALLQPHEISRAVGIENVFLVPDDPRSGMDFAELGELPPPESPVGKAVARWDGSLSGEGNPPSSQASPRLSPLKGDKGRPRFLDRLRR